MQALRARASIMFSGESGAAVASGIDGDAAVAEKPAAGISDRVEAAQPLDPPPFDTGLVGKQLEVCWPYKEAGR